MAALLLRQLVGVWQAAQGMTLADIAIWSDPDPAGAVEAQLLVASTVQGQPPLPPLRNGDQAASVADTPTWVNALADSLSHDCNHQLNTPMLP
eukprot:7429863-Prorocentrum_lima.AAC.1